MNIEVLVKFCRENGLCFDLHYSEVENSFSLHLTGPAEGEDFFVRHGGLSDVIAWGIEAAEKKTNG
jgi:hypothetical protein